MKPIVEILTAMDLSESGVDGVSSQPSAENAEKTVGRWVDNGEFLLRDNLEVQDANAAAANWLGSPRTELAGKNLEALLEARHEGWSNAFKTLLASRETFARCGMSEEGPDETYWFEIGLVRCGGGMVVRICSVLPGPTEMAEGPSGQRLHREGVLRQMFVRMLRAESHLQRLSMSWPGVIFIQKADLSFEYVNARMAEATGVATNVWRSDPLQFFKILHESDVEDVKQQLRVAVESKALTTTTFRIRNARTGRVSYMLEKRRALVSERGLVLGYEGAWVDVTRQMVAESRLAGAAWKETLAVVTMGQAHDFGNILSGIHALSDSYLRTLESGHPFYEGLDLVKQNALQAITLVRRIVNLHRENIGTKSYGDMSEMVRDSAELMKAIVNRRVKVTLETPETPMPLYVDEVELRQVVINLMLNASDAMPQGGTMKLSVSRHEEFPEMDFVQGHLPKLPAICFAVSDTGTGISRSRFQSVFDPFYTTKALKQGSGLGLYNASLFVDKHRGAISLESTEGVGSTFKIWLGESDFSEADRAGLDSEPARRGLLLLGPPGARMDSLAELLRLHGYGVVTAGNVDEAGELIASPDYAFTVLLVVMQSAGGSQERFMESVKKHRPELVVAAHLIGCHQDELGSSLLEAVDLVVGADGTENDFLKGLEMALQEMGKGMA